MALLPISQIRHIRALTAGLIASLLNMALPLAAGGQPGAARLGARPSNVAFRDLKGRNWSVLKPGALPAIYLFIATECDISNAYTPRILSLAKAARAGGVRLLAVYPDAADSARSAARHARSRGYIFPTVKDDGPLAAALGATITPEAVLLDRSGAICYRGRIDDDKDPSRVRRHDLADALAAVLAGRSVRRQTAAFGCVIQSTALKPAPAPRITYAENVAPIFYRNCLTCHRTGEVAPFSMESYKQVASWARMIKITTQQRIMPPWKASSHGEFYDERRLTDAEIATIGRWVDAGAPPGDLKRLAPPPQRPVAGWKLGTPDLVAGLKHPHAVGPDGRDEYHCFVIPTDYPEDRYISALEVHPGNRAIVHHVIAWLDTSGMAEKLDAENHGEGYATTGGLPGFPPAGFLGGWAPGNEPRLLRPGVGILLPRGARIVLEVHYHRDGKPESDQTTVGLHFCKGPVERRLRVLTVANGGLNLQPGNSDCVVRASTPLSKAITVLAVMPHMHMLGRKMRVSGRLPDGSETPLVDVRDWDFNWQVTYNFRNPVSLPAGTTIETVAHYDNSAGNPRNPNRPPRLVTWGEQTTDEMNIAFVFYTVDDEHLVTRPARSGRGAAPGLEEEMLTRSAHAISALALSACGEDAAIAQAAAASDQADKVALRFHLRAGDVRRYRRVNTQSPVDPGSAIAPKRSEDFLTITVVKVQPDGGFTESAQHTGTDIKATVVHDSRGRMTDFLIGDKPAPPLDRLFATVGNVVLPEAPVKPGDTWTVEIDNPVAKDAKLRIVYSYEGTETVDGVTAFKVRSRTSTEKPLRASHEALCYLDADGRLLRAHAVLTGLPSFEGPTQNVSDMALATSGK